MRFPRDSLSPKELADETVFLSLDHSDYAVNLTRARADELRTELAPFLEKARTVGEVSILSLRKQLQAEFPSMPSDSWVESDEPMGLTYRDSTLIPEFGGPPDAYNPFDDDPQPPKYGPPFD